MPRPLLGYLGTFANTSKNVEARVEQYVSDGVPILMDSGAFSVMQGNAKIDVNEHADWSASWAQRWPGRDVGFFALDVIGDFDATLSNYDTGRATMPTLIPTIHYGTDPNAVIEYVERGATTIGLGGMVPFLKDSMIDNVIAWSAAVLRHTLPAGIRTHALGATPPRFVGHLPIDSVDSTYWMNPVRWGTHSLFDPTIDDWRKMSRDHRDPYRHSRMIANHYDIDPAIVNMNARDVGADLPLWLSARSHALFAEYGRRRHGGDFTVFLAGTMPDLPLQSSPPPTRTREG